MKKLEMSLYSNPTSTPYIDPDKNYVARLTRTVNSTINCFVDRDSAAECINTSINNTEQFYALRPAIHNVVDKIHSIHRFTEVSVVVLAFRLMNKASGFCFLDSIRREQIQSLMLDATMSDL